MRAVLMLAAAMTVLAVSTQAQPPAASRTPAVATAPAQAAFDALSRDYDAFLKREDPISAGFEGDQAALSRLPDVSPAADARRLQALRGFRARLGAIAPAGLTDEGRVNHAFLTRVLDDAIADAGFDLSRLVFQNDSGFHTLYQYLSSATVIRSEADAEAWIARLEAGPAWYDANIANARRGIATHFTQPRSVVEVVLPVARTQAAATIDGDPMLAPLAALPASIPAPRQAELRARARRAVEAMKPQQQAFVRFLETEYLPAARPGLGIRSVPQGEALYRHLVRRFTTTNMTPDEVHALGEREVARIRGEMEGVIRETGFRGSFAEFLTFLRTDPQFYAISREQMMQIGSEIAKRADDQLPRLFRTLPRLSYGVRPVPREIEDAYTTGRYNPGSPQNGVAGGLMLNTGNLRARPLYELPALVLHEGAPGHHIQIALAQEAAEQPYWRRNAEVTAFTEGWGLYSEFLGNEMGIYRTPYERFGRLSYEMWRACRLVADTGIHWLGWDIERARACFRDNSALSEHNIETELQRYISWPGQALAYKVGELTLKRLRARAQERLGARFDVRDFHDQVLLQGPLPMDLLEERIDRWIAAGGPRMR